MSGRKMYTDKVRWIARRNAGMVQKETGVPASLLCRIRSGKPVRLQPKTAKRLTRYYDRYFREKMKQSGLRAEERRELLDDNRRQVMYSRMKKLRTAARLVRDMRRQRDAGEKEYKSTWHTTKDILKQMRHDRRRIWSDWIVYSKIIYGLPAVPEKLPRGGLRVVNMPRYVFDKKKHRKLDRDWYQKKAGYVSLKGRKR